MSQRLPMISPGTLRARVGVPAGVVLLVIFLACSPGLLEIVMHWLVLDPRSRFIPGAILFALWQAAAVCSTISFCNALSASPDPARGAAVWRWVLGLRWRWKLAYLVVAEAGWAAFLVHRLATVLSSWRGDMSFFGWLAFLLGSWLVYLVPLALLLGCGHESENSYRLRHGLPPRRRSSGPQPALQSFTSPATLGEVVPQPQPNHEALARLQADIAAVEASGRERHVIDAEIEYLKQHYSQE